MLLTKTFSPNSAIFIEKKRVENQLLGKSAFLSGKRINLLLPGWVRRLLVVYHKFVVASYYHHELHAPSLETVADIGMSSPPVHVNVSCGSKMSGKQGIVPGDSSLKPVMHKVGKMMCWVRVTIIGVFNDSSLSSQNVDAAAAVLQAILAIALQEDWLSGSLCMRPHSMPK